MMMSPRLMPMRNSMRRSGGTLGVALGHAALDLDRAAHRVDDAGELDQQAVAGDLDDAAAMLRDLGVDELAPNFLQSGEGSFFIDAHQAGIAGHVGGQDRRQTPLDPFLCHCRRLGKWSSTNLS